MACVLAVSCCLQCPFCPENLTECDAGFGPQCFVSSQIKYFSLACRCLDPLKIMLLRGRGGVRVVASGYLLLHLLRLPHTCCKLW